MSLILSETDLWEGRSLSEITPVEYEGLMASDVINATNHALKNCSLTRLDSRWLFLTVRMSGNRLQLAENGLSFSTLQGIGPGRPRNWSSFHCDGRCVHKAPRVSTTVAFEGFLS